MSFFLFDMFLTYFCFFKQNPVYDFYFVLVGSEMCIRHLYCVERFDFLRGYENIVCDLVSDDNLSVAVVDDASGRVYDVIHHRVVRCVDLVLVIKNLYREQLGYQNACHQAKPDFQLSVSAEAHIISSHLDPASEPLSAIRQIL